jgi:hypothetical protein
MVTIKMTPEDAARLAEGSVIFKGLTGCPRCWVASEYLAHFTAMAEQQRKDATRHD